MPKYKKKLENLRELMAPILSAGASETGMVIHDERCHGCGNCIVACPMNVANDAERKLVEASLPPARAAAFEARRKKAESIRSRISGAK